MLKSLLLVLFISSAVISGCSNDDNPVTPPVTGEVLIASVSVDSVMTSVPGFSFRSSTVLSGTLNFTDRDSARISFYYSGQNNSVSVPMEIYYTVDTTKIYLFNSSTLNPTIAEQFVNVTVPSPRVNASFKYRISSGNTAGPTFFTFRELNIYKK